MKRLIPLLLCFALVLPGCVASTADGNRTIAEGTGAGAVVGGVLGGVMALATGDAKWVAIGAGVGGLVGLGAGVYVAKKKEEYASKEQWLNACIREAQSSNQAIASYNANLRSKLAQLNNQSAKIAAEYRMQKGKVADLNKLRQSIKQQQQEADGYINNVEKQIARQNGIMSEARAENKTREAQIIEAEIRKMEMQLDELRDNASKFASVSTRVSI